MDNLLIKLFSKAEDYFFQSIARRAKDFSGAASAYSSDINDSPLNTLVIRKPVPSLEQLTKDTADFFNLTNMPWCIVMRADLLDKDSKGALEKCGFMPAEVSVAMVLPLSDTADISTDDSRIKNMDDKLDDWAIPLQAYPATSKDVAIQYAQSHKLALERKRNMSHLSLFKNNEIVSSITLSCSENWARIDDVATIPQYQRKGNATTLMRYAIRLAAQKGAQFCFLEASPKGLSIYQKLGFKEVFKNQVFTKGKSS
jgi:predicted GNAT family acetyltransferase